MFAKQCVRAFVCVLVLVSVCVCVCVCVCVNKRESDRPGFNFINILQAAFACADPKCIKMIFELSIFFTLLGSTSVKALCKMLTKFTLG